MSIIINSFYYSFQRENEDDGWTFTLRVRASALVIYIRPPIYGQLEFVHVHY